uniref:Uncharacterized protein n=1 Tax=Arundo donax TaxID=35708 RepID=A0A0A9BUX9_ARUDO
MMRAGTELWWSLLAICGKWNG